MAALPAVPQVLKVLVQGNGGEATPITWANVLHFAYSGTAPTAATCSTTAVAVQNLWATHMAPECVSNVNQNLCQVIDLTSATAGSGQSNIDNVGTRGDDEIPANVAFLVAYPLQRRYRGGHPRSYLYVGGDADFLDAAHWSSAFTKEVHDHWQAFLQGIVGYSTAGMTINNFVNVSYHSGKDVNGKPIVRPVPLVDVINTNTIVAEQQIASQRRRVGRHRR